MPPTWEPLAPDDVRPVLAGLVAPWWVTGGWGVDLRLGRGSRPHEDLDVAVLRRDADDVRRHLAAWDVHLVHSQGVLRPWHVGEPVPARAHNAWCRRAPGEPWSLELLFEDATGDEWVYRRDARIRRPLRELGDGNLLALDVTLLYKSARPRASDEADFTATRAVLDDAEREWLAAALRTAAPGHPWLARLGSPAPPPRG